MAPHITPDPTEAIAATAAALRVTEVSCHTATVRVSPGRLEAFFNVWSCLYVVWWSLSAQSGCGPNICIAWAAPVQKTRPEKLLMVPNGSLAT